MKDLEDPYYNQILYVPTLEYNYYDGLLPGLRFHNKTILDKPFIFDLNPTISTKTSSLSGKGHVFLNQYNRDSKLYNIRYLLSGHYLHYQPDAYYSKIAPTLELNFRPDDYRSNKKSAIVVKNILVNKQKSAFEKSAELDNYNIFNLKYFTNQTEIRRHFRYVGNFEYTDKFSKMTSEVEYRNFFDDNRLLGVRVFLGTFLFNKTDSDYYSFGLDRPSDYLFESEYLGRSETSGLLSQQSIVSDGFFKSMFQTRFANQWMATTNLTYTIWNWIEIYGDIGVIKNKLSTPVFVHDSGIRLNLVTNYFELFFPVYSNNGWEISQKNYAERIRFIIAFDPKTLTRLFTRKWF